MASLLYVGDFAPAGVGPLHLGSVYTHIWSLAIEEQFYAVWPLILVFFLVRRVPDRRRVVLVGFAVTAPLVQLASSLVVRGSYLLPTGHIVPIAVGCMSAELFTSGAPIRLVRLAKSQALPWVALAILGFLVVGYRTHGSIPDVLVTTAVAAATGALILHLCEDSVSSPARQLLSASPMVWIGRRSYGLYLYHRTIAGLLPLLIPGVGFRFAAPVVVASSVALAGLSYRFVERPIIDAGRRRRTAMV